MLITKYGHSCLAVTDGQASILIDPGTFSTGFEVLTGLTAILITHQHPDHLDMARFPALVEANPQATVYADTASAENLQQAGIPATAVTAGDQLDVGTPVSVHGQDHAVIHTDIPVIPNAAYLIGGRLLHPGDSFSIPDATVEILALPVAAPWMALKEAVEYFRAIDPVTAFGIHERLLASPALSYGLLKTLAPKRTSWLDLDGSGAVEL